MVLKVLGSSSKGNCYILENSQEALIIEAGISFSKVRSATFAGCIKSRWLPDLS
jgi:hypothetical protein